MEKYYIFSTEIDTVATGRVGSSYLRAVEAIKARESLLEVFREYDDTTAEPYRVVKADTDAEAVADFLAFCTTDHVKGCGPQHAFFEYTLYRASDVEASKAAEDEDDPFYCTVPECLAHSVSDMFDDEEEED